MGQLWPRREERGTLRHRQMEGCNSDRAAAGFGSIFSRQPLLYFYYSLNKPFDRSEVCILFNTEI